MNTHQTPEDKNINPEPRAPKLPESLAMDPKIQTERDDIKGQVLYSSKPEEIGTEQTPAEAYKTATNNHLAAIANKDPNWIQKALITRKIANEREQIVIDDLANRQGKQNRRADLLTGKQQEDWLRLQVDLESDKAILANKKANTRSAKLNGTLRKIFSGLGTVIISPIAGGVNAWQNIREERKNRHHNLN